MTVAVASDPSAVSPCAARISRLRALMKERDLDAVIVRSTDRYLNEYVPTAESTRVYLTGFTGSMGDALVTHDRAILFVDGRYELQARREATALEVRVLPLGTTIEEGWLAEAGPLAGRGVKRVGVESDRMTVSLYTTLEERARRVGWTLVPTVPSLIEAVRKDLGPPPPRERGRFWPVSADLTGDSVKSRLEKLEAALAENVLDGMVVIPLDEIAWITNLRGDQLDYQATFRAQAVVLKDRVLLAAPRSALKKGAEVEPEVNILGARALADAVRDVVNATAGKRLRLGFDPDSTPQALIASLHGSGADLVSTKSPFAKARTIKNDAELAHMCHAFARADVAVQKLQRWLARSLDKGVDVSERDVADKMAALWKREGAWALSFKVIAAAGANGAIIHYSDPDPDRKVAPGELFLLDTGGYFEGGYATDLTRTFLAGGRGVKATPAQQRLFTLVLKAAIAGMSARFPKGTTGAQLDALVRAPLWADGLDFAHGTGHGVGVNVHEAPPRVRPFDTNPLEVGQVFSIEPGVYLPGEGGVRIENLCTVVADDENPAFLRVKPLTFSPFDARLIDARMLSAGEKAFVAWFKARWRRPWAERPAPYRP